MRLLLIEDDLVLTDALMRLFAQEGHVVEWVNDGSDADTLLIGTHFDLVILDLSLPRMDGFEILRRLRQRGGKVPVLILTARDGVENRIKGLDLGADDYLAKPFDLSELKARVRALIRRGQSGMGAQLTCGELSFDTVGRQASLGGVAIDLSAREVGVLETLLLRAGKVVSKELLVEQIRDLGEELSPNAIEVYVSRLRKKLEACNINIRTLRGLGYMLEKQ